MKKIFSFLVLPVVYALLSISPVSAVGVAVAPAEIAMNAIVGEATTVRIKVTNPSNDVAVFEVYPDDFPSVIKAIPASFTLESQSEKYVTIEVAAREIGKLSTVLSVVARPLASNAFQAGSGVKVPFIVTITSNPSGLASALGAVGGSPWTGIIALVVLTGSFLYRIKRKREVAA